jgi:drug/metabolite transporter (DMT)-like permease
MAGPLSAAPAILAQETAPARAILFACSSVVLFTTMVTLIKSLGARYPLMQVVFCRGLFALVPLAPLVLAGGGRAALHTSRPLGHVVRGVIGVVGTAAMYYAYGRLPLADSIALSFTTPLFVTALSAPLLGERVGWRRAAAILVGFVGVLVIARPSGEIALLPATVAVFGNGLIALSIILVRRLSRTERNVTIVFYYTVASTVIAGGFVPFQWLPAPGGDLAVLAGIGILGGLAHLLLTQAYRLAPVAVVAPFDYTAILWAALFGFALWGELPDPNLALGAPIVIGSGLYILLHGRRDHVAGR